VLDVERRAELRREHFVRGMSIKELARRFGVDRNTVRRALRSAQPPRYERPARPSKLDPFKEEIHKLLRADLKLPGVRVRELIEPLGFQGSKTIVHDYLCEVHPLFAPRRSFQRTVYRPGEICQWDLWEPSGPRAHERRRCSAPRRHGRASGDELLLLRSLPRAYPEALEEGCTTGSGAKRSS
jgi:transposase